MYTQVYHYPWFALQAKAGASGFKRFGPGTIWGSFHRTQHIDAHLNELQRSVKWGISVIGLGNTLSFRVSLGHWHSRTASQHCIIDGGRVNKSGHYLNEHNQAQRPNALAFQKHWYGWLRDGMSSVISMEANDEWLTDWTSEAGQSGMGTCLSWFMTTFRINLTMTRMVFIMIYGDIC